MNSRLNNILFIVMRYLFFFTALFICTVSNAQRSDIKRSDFILLKKKNNRTLKSYFNGVFISASTYNGFTLNGVIKDIRNDSVFVEQQSVYQVATQFGVPALDTVVYTIGIYYQDIMKFNFSKHDGGVGKSGFAQVALPMIMTLGGAGYVVLETVNTLYRNESFGQKGKLRSMGIAAGIAVGGIFLKRIQAHKNEAGVKFKVVYMKMN